MLIKLVYMLLICSFIESGNYNPICFNTPLNETNSLLGEDTIEYLPWDAVPYKDAVPETEILNRINNSISMDELITKKYAENDLLKYTVPNVRMVNIDSLTEIECIRKLNDDMYYVVLQSKEGGILYLLLVRQNDEIKTIANGYWYVKGELLERDLQNAVVNHYIITHVRRMDPYGYYPVDMAGYYSYSKASDSMMYSSHITTDGYCVILKYSVEGNDTYTVSDISTVSNPWLDMLLQMDIPPM